MTVTIRAATVADAAPFAEALREDDRREAEASGHPAEIVLLVGIGMSAQAFCALEGSEPLAIWGYAQAGIMDDTAGAWLLTCTGVERHRKAFVRAARLQIQIWRDAGLVLTGVVDARYAKAMRWLAREGFAIDARTVSTGPQQLPFHPFRSAS